MMQIDLATLATTFVAAIGSLAGLLGYISQQSKNLREIITAGDTATAEVASRERVTETSTLRSILTEHRADIEMLKRDSVRREELAGVERRNSEQLDKLGVKIDRMSDQLGQIPALAAKLDLLAERNSRQPT